jgi:serine/threonine protein kinase
LNPKIFMSHLAGKNGLVGHRLSHFVLLERIGEGGMGVVYKAEDETLHRLVALKLVSPRRLIDPAQYQRLLREARSAAAVNHPNIAAIYEVGEADGIAYIAMEYVEGATLRSLILEKPLSENAAIKYAVQIAAGLARAHSAGIVHRDLKPENVVIQKDGHAKILDFGLARAFDSSGDAAPAGSAPSGDPSITRSEVFGTPPYMSPEQTEGRDVDARSDIYSFGVLFHELLTAGLPTSTRSRTVRARPFSSSARARMLAQTGRRLSPGTSMGARPILRRCLQTRRELRFENGSELLDALQELSRAKLFGRRSRWVALGALLALVILTISAFTISGHLVSPPTRTERRLTANPPEQLIEDAALSPDGTMLAYVAASALYVRHLDPLQTDQIRLPDEIEPTRVSWFPDSRTLFVASAGKAPGTTIWKVSTEGTLARLGQIAVRSSPRLSPDGSAYAWTDAEGAHWQLLNETTSHLAAPAATDDQLLGLVWSPTSRAVALLRAREFNKEPKPVIETVDLRSGARRVVVDDPHLLQESGRPALGWAPDGRLLYGLAEWPPHETGTSLYGLPVDPDSGIAKDPPAHIASWTSAVSEQLTASSDGKLSFLRFSGQLDVYVAEFDESAKQLTGARRFTLTERDERPTGWAPDGKSIVFMSNQNGGQHLFIQSLASAEARMLTTGSSWNTWGRFDPKGALLFWRMAGPGSEPTKPVLMRMDPATYEMRQLLTAGAPAPLSLYTRPPPRKTQFRCALKAGECVLGELEGDELRLSAFDSNQGPGPELLRIPVTPSPWYLDWDLSPDGRRAALPRWDGKIRVADLSDGSIVDIPVDKSCIVQSAAWAATGDGLFATASCPGKVFHRLLYVELTGKTHLLRASPNEWFSCPVPSPDGKHLAFALKPQQTDAWLMEKF